MRILLTVLLTFGFLATTSAQELNLFEQIDAEPASFQPDQSSQLAGQNGQPAFTLRGTSRFGDEYHTTLIARNGEVTKLVWHTGETVPVPGFPGFTVVDINQQGVSLQQPASDVCVNFPASGVSCASTNVATLKLATAAVLATNGTSVPLTPQAQDFSNPGFTDTSVQVSADANAQQVFINPFSGQAEVVNEVPPGERRGREERQRRRAERLSNFEPVRISDGDVPPGMKVVRTPFGDRLVPESE